MDARLSWGHLVAFWIAVMLGMAIAYNQDEKHPNIIDAFVCIGMICAAGLRHGYIDTRAYRNSFLRMDVAEILNLDYILSFEGRENGFSVVTAIIKLFVQDAQIYLLILSAFTVGFLFAGIIKRVPDRRIGIFLFIMVGCYVDTMNGARQALVSALLFYYLPQLIKERRPLRYFLLVLMASALHGTALILLPLYFVVDKKAWSNYTIAIVGIMLFVFAFYNFGFGRMIADALEGTYYADNYGDMLLQGNTRTNFLRVPIAFMPIALSFFNRKQEDDEPLYNIAFHMTLMGAACWLISQRVLYFYRLAAYFTPYSILLLCYEIHRAYVRRGDNQMQLAILALYTILHVANLYIMGDLFFVGYLRY